MAKKSTTKTASALSVENGVPTLMIPLAKIRINSELAAREGAPDPEKIAEFAASFVDRRENGQNHQIQPAVVRIADGDLFEIIDGTHRFYGCQEATKASKEEFPLWAFVVPDGDEAALVTAIQANAFREEPTVFDNAASVEKLIAMGKSQADCAGIFNVSEGTISQWRKVAKLEKKYRKAVENDDIEMDAAILIAGAEGDETLKTEIFDIAIKAKERFERLSTEIDNKKAKAEADARIAEAKERADKLKAEAARLEGERKAVEKAVKEIESTATKTKDVDELVKIRTEAKRKKDEADALAAKEKEAIAATEKAKKDVEKATKAKAELKEKIAAKPKVTAEDIKHAAKEKGAKVGAGTPSPRNTKQLKVELKAMCEDKDNPVPESITNLCGKIEGFLDGDYSAKQLVNAFLFNCRSDEELAKHAASTKKRK